MSEIIFGYVSAYGLPIVAISAFLSCLALPIPTSAAMLAAGAFAATGDLILWQVIATAWGAAVLGDQTGYFLGRWGGTKIVAALESAPRRAKLVSRARDLMLRRGAIGIFFSTWLFAPLGPWVNFLAGSAKFPWVRFTLWDVAGETIWVVVYVFLGFAFTAQISNLSALLNDWIGLITAAFVTASLGFYLVRKARR